MLYNLTWRREVLSSSIGMGKRIVALDNGEVIEERNHRGERTYVSAAEVPEKPGQSRNLLLTKMFFMMRYAAHAMVLTSVLLASAYASAAHIYRFATPGVTDLSRREDSSPAATRRDVAHELLDANAADELRRRTDCGADGP